MATKTEFASTTVHDLCLVAATCAGEIHAPLTFLDMPWLYFTPVQRLIFYRIPQLSRSQFLENIIPNLKHSLSLTLERFPILAGNLIIFSDSDSAQPEICYKNGDGVTLISAECSVDFNSLVHNEDRDCADFYPLVPELRPSSDSDESIRSSTPVLALQVTLFPEFGLCIGFSNSHCVGDARSMFSFMRTWSILSSNLSKGTDVVESQLPVSVFDKNLIKDSRGFARVMFDEWRNFVAKGTESPVFASGAETMNKVRRTFVLTAKDVEKLKKLVSGERSVRVTSFTVIYSYIWTCLVKSQHLLAKDCDDDGEEEKEHYIGFAADCRERTDPPIPGNYFGNSLVPCIASAKGAELAGGGGLGMAAELLGKSIHQKFLHKDAVFDGVETAMGDILKLNLDFTVAGSTRYNYYELDFGWGKPDKFEFISIDMSGAISLTGCRDGDKGAEVGLSLTKPRMNAFTSVFIDGFNA